MRTAEAMVAANPVNPIGNLVGPPSYLSVSHWLAVRIAEYQSQTVGQTKPHWDIYTDSS